MRKFTARWANDQEKASGYNNGVVEADGFCPYPRLKFYVSPMADAERIAYALNFVEKFSNEELKRLSDALTK